MGRVPAGNCKVGRSAPGLGPRAFGTYSLVPVFILLGGIKGPLGGPGVKFLLGGFERPRSVLVGLPGLLSSPRPPPALSIPRRVVTPAGRAPAGQSATVGRALGFPSPAPLPVGPRATPSAEGWFWAVALDMAPFPTLEALLRLKNSPIGLAVE